MKPTDEDRFWSSLVMVESCWEWVGGTHKDGYGRMWADNKDQYAHRVAWQLLRGPIPDGLTIDHLCRNRRCVNPEHMEIVTGRENILRGTGPSAKAARRTHCDNGHPLDASFTLRSGPKAGTTHRYCRICQNERRSAHREATK